MSSDLLKKYAMIVESGNFFHNPDVPDDEQLPAPPEEVDITEDGDDDYIYGLLDQLEESLQEAVDVCRQLERSAQLGRVVNAYTRPWLQAWISDRHQMGSVFSMRETIEADSEEDED